MKNVIVVAAIITYKQKILCVQRGFNKYDYISEKYEFPGGKLEKGESEEEAIKREILEELKMRIKVEEYFMTVEHQYPDFYLTMKVYKCSSENEHLILSEHIDFRWLTENQIKVLDWAAADIPIVNKIIKKGGRNVR